MRRQKDRKPSFLKNRTPLFFDVLVMATHGPSVVMATLRKLVSVLFFM